MSGAANAAIASVLPTSGGGASTLLYDGINPTAEGAWDFCDQASHNYAGNYNFTVSANCTVTDLKFKLSKTAGSITGLTFLAAIYSQSTNDMNAAIGTSTGVTGDNTWAKTTVNFNFSSPMSLVTGTNYAVVIYQNGTIGNTNYASAWYTTPTVIPGQMTYFNTSKVNQFVGTFPLHDVQFQVWGTTP